MPATSRMTKFLCRLSDNSGVGDVRWTSKAKYDAAQKAGTLGDPLLGHAIDPGQSVYLAGEVIFITRTTEADRLVIRFFLKSIYQPVDIVLVIGNEFARI